MRIHTIAADKRKNKMQGGTARTLVQRRFGTDQRGMPLDRKRAGNKPVLSLLRNRASSLDPQEPIMRSPEEATTGPELLATLPGLLPAEVPMPGVVRTEAGILATVYFGQNDFLLNAANFRLVEQLSEELRFMPDATVIVDGHASTEGSSNYNMELSGKRRQTILALLRSKPASFGGAAYGESQPAVEETGKTAADAEKQRAQNRRAVISIVPAGKKQKPAKPLDLSLPPMKPPTLEQDLGPILKEAPPAAREKQSLSDMGVKKLDEIVEDILSRARVRKEHRGLIKEGSRRPVESGLEKALDTALDPTGLNDKEKKVIENAIDAAAKTKFY